MRISRHSGKRRNLRHLCLLGFTILIFPFYPTITRSHAALLMLSDQDVIALNTNGVCPVGRLVLSAKAGAASAFNQLDPVAAQWSGVIHLKAGQTVEAAGLSAIQDIVLTCHARIASRGVLREAVGDLIINADRFTDSIGNEWRLNAEPKSKFVTLAPLLGYADRASVENDSPTLLPVGYLFKTDWSNHLSFIKLIRRNDLPAMLRQQKETSSEASTANIKKHSRRKPVHGNEQPGRHEKAGPVPVMAGIPTGTSPDAKFDYYLKMAPVFKKYHDSDVLYVQDVLDSLIHLGLMPAKGAEEDWAPTPFPTIKYQAGFRWPLDAGIVSSEYGWRWGRNHDGIDVAANINEPVFASADGQVVYAGNGFRGYGNVLMIRHDAKTVTLYAHNRQILVAVGDWVRMSQLIALVGSTGHSTGPHVHFELRIAGHPLNPRLILPKTRF